MGHSSRDLKLYSKIIVDSKPWLVDPKIVPLPWRSIELPRQLCFAIIKSNDVINPLPPVSRAMDTTVQKLKDAGHEIIEWQLNDQHDTSELSVRPFYDGRLTGSINSLRQGVSLRLPLSSRSQENPSRRV